MKPGKKLLFLMLIGSILECKQVVAAKVEYGFDKGKMPISALCVYMANNLDVEFKDDDGIEKIFVDHQLPIKVTVDVNQCENSKTTGEVVDRAVIVEDVLATSTYLFQMKLIPKVDETQPMGEVRYELVGKLNPTTYVLHYYISYGGTAGAFDAINIVKLENGELESLKYIGGGQKNIGTFEELELDGNKLSYSRNSCKNQYKQAKSHPNQKGVLVLTPEFIGSDRGIPDCQ